MKKNTRNNLVLNEQTNKITEKKKKTQTKIYLHYNTQFIPFMRMIKTTKQTNQQIRRRKKCP